MEYLEISLLYARRHSQIRQVKCTRYSWNTKHFEQRLHQKVETTKRALHSKKVLSSRYVMGAMFLPSALNRSIPPGITSHF